MAIAGGKSEHEITLKSALLLLYIRTYSKNRKPTEECPKTRRDQDTKTERGSTSIRKEEVRRLAVGGSMVTEEMDVHRAEMN